MKTIENLGIYWPIAEKKGHYHDEVDGLVFYGYWAVDFEYNVIDTVPIFLQCWPPNTVEIITRDWDKSSDSKFSIELRVLEWPKSNWLEHVKLSLKWFISNGAEIAWCGNEFTTNSISVFNPNQNCGEVYAAYTRKGYLYCNSDLQEEYRCLDKKDLSKIWSSIINTNSSN
jgi:hypothetical protein